MIGLWLLSCFGIAYAAYIFFDMVMERKKEKWKIVLSYIAFIVLELALEYIHVNLLGMIMLNLSVYFLLSLSYIGTFVERILYVISFYVFGTLCDVFVTAISEILDICEDAYKPILMVAVTLLQVSIMRMLKLFFRNRTIRSGASLGRNILLLTLPLGTLLIAYYMVFPINNPDSITTYYLSIVVVILLFALNVGMYYAFVQMAEQYRIRNEHEVYQLEIDLYDEHMKEKEHSIQEFRKAKHDLKHQLTFLHNLIVHNSMQEAKKYIEDILKLEAFDGLAIAYSENDVIDALVNYKVATAKQYGIACQIDLKIPNWLPFSNSDLCVLLGNALDNAIEANRILSKDEKYIHLKMKYDSPNLIIVVSNSFDSDVIQERDGLYETWKVDKLNHGIGLISIKNILNKYNGDYSIETEENCFKISMVMYGENDDKDSNM